MAFVIDADIERIDANAKAIIAASLRDVFKCIEPSCYIHLTVKAGSVNVESAITLPNTATSYTLANAVSSAVTTFANGNATDMTEVLNLGVKVLSACCVSKRSNVLAPVAPSGNRVNLGNVKLGTEVWKSASKGGVDPVVIGVIVGLVVLLGLSAAVFIYVKRRRQRLGGTTTSVCGVTASQTEKAANAETSKI